MSDIEVAGLVTKISVDDAQVEQSMASLSRQMQIAKSQAQVASSGMNALGNSTQAMRMRSEALSKQMQIQGARVAKLQQEHAKAATEKGKDAKETQKLEVQLNKAVAEYNRLDGQLKSTNKELATQASKWTQVGNNLESAGAKLQKVGKGMESAGTSLTRNVSLPLAAAGGLAIKASVDYESAFAGVRKTVDTTEEKLAEISTGIRGMSKEIPAAATEIAKVAESAGQLGIQTDAILGFTRTMVDLGETTNLTSDQAATALARLANITQMPQDRFDELGSTIVALGNNLATTESEIVEMGLRLAGAGKQVGMSEAQILSLAGALSSVGIEAEAGGSAMSKVMINMQLATEKGGQGLADFANVAGMSATEFKKAYQEDAAGALIAFIQGLGNAEKQGKSAITMLDDMGISEVRMRDALLRAAGAGDLFNKSMEIGTEAWAENTALTKEAAQRYETTASKLNILKNRATDIGVTLGDALVPAMTDALKAAEPFFTMIENGARAFSAMDKETQRTILKYIGLALAAGPALTVTGKLTNTVGGLARVAGSAAKFIGAKGAGAGLTAATSALGSTTAGAAGGAGLLSSGIAGLISPVGLAVGALAVLGTGAYFLHRNMKQDAIPAVRQFGDEVSDSTKKAVEGFMELYDQADVSLKQLKWSGETVSKDMAATMTANFDGMSSQIIASLEDSRKEGTESLHKLFAESTTISEDEQAAMLDALNEGYDNRIATIEEQNARIKEILETASEERRELTRQEQAVISVIQTEMKNTAIATMSDGELEQKAILERMRADVENFSALQAAEVVKNSKEQKEKAVAEAERQYQESVKQFIFLRDDAKSITADQADMLIREAKRQRDEVVALAESMNRDVVAEARRQAKGHIDEVDWETGEILSKWQVFFRRLTGMHSESRPTFNPATGYYDLYPPVPGPARPSQSTRVRPGGGPLLAFDGGGTVPGPIGSPQVILAHGGETVLPTHKPNYQQEQKVHHTFDPLIVKGVNDRGELVAVVESTMKDILYWEER